MQGMMTDRLTFFPEAGSSEIRQFESGNSKRRFHADDLPHNIASIVSLHGDDLSRRPARYVNP